MRYDDEQREWARQLRRDMNEAAQLLWQRLRGRHSGRARFRREHPLGPYTADFLLRRGETRRRTRRGVAQSPEGQTS